MKRKTLLLVLALVSLAALLLPSCANTQQSRFITVSSQPANVGDAGTAALAYHNSGAYDQGLQFVVRSAWRPR